MPDKPLWLDRLPLAIQQLSERAEPWVDRPALETALGIGRRRAQQLLSQVPGRRIGASIVAARSEIIAYLESLAAGETAHYEQTRRRKLWGKLQTSHAPVLVEVPAEQLRRIAREDFAGLPEGVELARGSITIRFRDPEEALQKLMALALAIGRSRAAFEERVSLV